MKVLPVTIAFFGIAAPLLPCDYDKLNTKNSKEQKISSGTVKLGVLQSGPKDRDPVVGYFANGKQVFCRKDYDTTGANARPVAATADGDHLYVAFSVDAGSTAINSFARFTKTGWVPAYGAGKGAKVLVILKITKSSGEPVAGTYVIARKKDGATNSVALKSLNFAAGKLSVVADAWSSPLAVSGEPFACSGRSPFRYYLDLQPDLSAARSAAADNCQFKTYRALP